jgi:hypothetical protein
LEYHISSSRISPCPTSIPPLINREGRIQELRNEMMEEYLHFYLLHLYLHLHYLDADYIGETESNKGYLETTITAHENHADYDREEIDEFFKGERRKIQKWMNDIFKIRVTTTDPLHRDIP